MQHDHEHEQDSPILQEKEQQPVIRRRRFLKRSSLAAGAATVFSFFGITPFASARTATPSGIASTALNASQANPYIQAVLNSSDYHRFQRLVQHKQPELFAIQEHQATATQVSSKTSSVVIVHIPVVGGAGYSFYSAVFQPQTATILQAQDALFTSAGGNHVDVYVERDGHQVFHKVLAPNGAPVDGSAHPLFNIGGILQCLADCFGVPLVVVIAAAATCSFVCAITDGLGCVVCVAVAINLGTVVGQECWDECKNQ